MPGGDRTGPTGAGSRTGRGLGYCADDTWSETTQNTGWSFGRGFGRSFGRSFGRGFGRGRGWRNQARAMGMPGRRNFAPDWAPSWWRTPPTPQDETALLKTQAEQLQTQLEAIQQRLTELEEK